MNPKLIQFIFMMIQGCFLLLTVTVFVESGMRFTFDNCLILFLAGGYFLLAVLRFFNNLKRNS